MSQASFARPDGKRPVALYISKLGGGGVEQATLAFARRLLARGWPVDLVVDRPEGQLADQVPQNVRLVDLAPAGWWAGARQLRATAGPGRRAFLLRQAPRRVMAFNKLCQYFREAQPIGVMSANPRCNIPAVAAREATDSPCQVAISERNPPSIDRKRGGPRRRQFGPLRHAWYSRADSIIAVSAGLAQDLARYARLPQERIQVIYHGVDINAVARGMTGKCPHAWLLDGGPPVIVAVGRLATQKNYPVLLRAVARLRQEQPVRLLIFGEGPERKKLEKLARRLGIAEAVDLPGYTDRPHGALARAAAFALPSRWEGMSQILLEAVACGCEIVAADCCCGPRELLADGKFGRLVPVDDVDGFTQGLRVALEDWRNQAKGQAVNLQRSRWLERFDAEATADRYLAAMGLPQKPAAS